MSNVTVMDPNRPALTSGGRIAAIVPQSMDEAYRLGKAVCLAGMAPKGMDTPEKCMIAIMQGLEVGMTPMQSLQRIAVVNGRPTIWGDGAMALVRASGICEYVRESMRGEGDKRVAGCVVKRRGEPEEVTRTFGVEDAKRAGLWGKAGPWQQYPDRMLAMRARAFALRDVFADVLGGMYLKEEMDDRGDVQPQGGGAARTIAPPPPSAPPAIEHVPEEEPFDATKWFEELELAMSGAKDEDAVLAVWSEFDPPATFTHDADDTNLKVAQAIMERRVRALAKDRG